MAWGWATSECWGPVGVGKQLLGSCTVLRTCPRIFGEVAELTRRNAVTKIERSKTKRGFTPFCKGLGIYYNGFWGCGALGPHKCNLSDLSHSIKEVEIVKERISIHGIIDTSKLRLLSCISYRQAYWLRKRERDCSSYFVRRGSEEKRREERERLWRTME